MEIKNLNFGFFSGPKKALLFDHLNLLIEPQEITVLLGPSGSGKSTLLRIFAELQEIDSKESVLFKDLKTESFIFQEATLLEWRTGYKNIMLPIEFSKTEVDTKYFQELSEILKLQNLLELFPYQLSGGQKMRIAIARALVTKPQVLFMDEPFAALDEPTRLELQDELIAIQRRFKMTILFVTHSFYEAVFLAQRMVVLNSKRPTEIIYNEPQIRDFNSRYEINYLKRVEAISNVLKIGTQSS